MYMDNRPTHWASCMLLVMIPQNTCINIIPRSYVHVWNRCAKYTFQHPPPPQVCGDGQAVEGDAVVPLRSGLLPGAQTRIVLRGVYHSMSRIGTFEEDSGTCVYVRLGTVEC